MGIWLANERPVTIELIRRTKRERQRIARDTRAGLECQLRIKVPIARTVRLVVMIRKGAHVSETQIGVMNKMRINRVVRAGLVLADVAVRCVDRKSVICKNGSSSTLHREVKAVSVSTISSKLF